MILDHAFMVPLSFVTPRMDLPIVPFHINSLLSPRPSAQRCYRLGQQLGEFIRNHHEGKVAVLASGSFSGDIGGPKIGFGGYVLRQTICRYGQRGKAGRDGPQGDP